MERDQSYAERADARLYGITNCNDHAKFTVLRFEVIVIPSGCIPQISTNTSAAPEYSVTRAALVVEDRGIDPMAQKGL